MKIALFMVLFLLSACATVEQETTTEVNGTSCTPEQREADICIALYAPVCGWFNQDIKCIKYPCAATYSNSCGACQDEKVSYWTDGECPTG